MTAKAQILKSIRHKCIDCCADQLAEVRNCHLQDCSLWPYRFGLDPSPAKPRGVAKSTSQGSVFGKKRGAQ